MDGIAVIEKELAAQANRIAAPDGAPTSTSVPAGYEPFQVGKLGYFPYYWQDPRNGEFNAKTYEWIDCALKAAAWTSRTPW